MSVIPAKAGIQFRMQQWRNSAILWIPAFAGMTIFRLFLRRNYFFSSLLGHFRFTLAHWKCPIFLF